MPSLHNKSKISWRKRRVKTLRKHLIEQLGNRCVNCGTTERLEFNHIYEKTWVTNSLNWYARLLRIRQEIAYGWIDLRCKSCNKAYTPLPLTACEIPF